MRKLATFTAAFGVLVAIGNESPANAATGQCFDGYGRPYGPPYSTKTPPLALFCEAYRRGGQCQHVQPGWAESYCGLGRRYRYRDDRYHDDYPRYRRRYYDY